MRLVGGWTTSGTLPLLALAGSLLLGAASSAQAANFSFTGAFTRDDQVQFFEFSVGLTSDVTLRSYSYAGGTNAAGALIPAGGFDPNLALFTSSGVLVGQNDDGSCAKVGSDPRTHDCFDTFMLSSALPAGDYFVAMSEYNNFAGATLSNPFSRAGQGDFTVNIGGGSAPCQPTAPAFNDSSGVAHFCERTGNWAFDILNVAQAQETTIPEPGAVLLFGVALGVLGVTRRYTAAIPG